MLTVVIPTFGSDHWREMGDDTLSTLYQQTDREFSAVRYHGENLCEARNTAVSMAKTPWVTILDADDRLDNDFVASMKSKLDMIGDYSLVRPSVTLSDEPNKVFIHEERNIFEANFMIIGTTFSVAMFERAGGFRDYPIYEDWEFWIRCRIAGAVYDTCPSAIYHIMNHESSRNKQPFKVQLEIADNIRTEYSEYDNNGSNIFRR